MKRTIYLCAFLLAGGAAGLEAQNVEGVKVLRPKMERHGDLMSVDLTLDLSNLHVAGNRVVLLTPRIAGNEDTLALPAVGVYGRRRYYYYMREDDGPISGSREQMIRASRMPDTLAYRVTVPYAEWMDGSELLLHRGDFGCCRTLLAQDAGVLAGYKEAKETRRFMPEFVYVQPVRETVKNRSLSGSAFIDFPVNRTEIRPDYRGNAQELAKIRATIDSVRNDKDVSITALAIKGFASPEGGYANNERLAKGRTESLRKYVDGLYSFADGTIGTSYEAENWEGLRAYVADSDLPGKEGILALIDGDREPDNKEWKLKSDYPEAYRQLLAQCYPALRRTDYRIEYVVKHFTDVDEIRRLVQTRPQKLSLEEFQMAAQGLEPGSGEFNRIFETAAYMFPEDGTANLNAANSAMQRGDLEKAGKYLAEAGDTPEAKYARGVHAALCGDYGQAEAWLDEVKAVLPQAAEALRQVEELAKQ